MSTHPCPAGCGSDVSDDLVCCWEDFDRLPVELLQPLTPEAPNQAGAWRHAREVLNWFDAHPLPAAACRCGDAHCLHFQLGYTLCRLCEEHHRPPECAVETPAPSAGGATAGVGPG